MRSIFRKIRSLIPQKAFKIAYITISVLLAAYPYLGYSGYLPFYKNSMKAIAKLRELNRKKIIKQDEKTYELKAGFVQRRDVGFSELLSIIKQKRDLDPIAKDVEEIGLVYGELPLKVTRISPNAMVYVQFVKDGEKIQVPIIFHQFDPYTTRQLGELINWVKEVNVSRINHFILFLIPVWAALGVLITFKS